MKKSAKKVLAMVLVGIMSASLMSGCSKKEESNSNSQEGTAAESSTVNTEGKTEEVKMEKIRVWSSNAHEKELRLQQIEDFNNSIGKEKGIEIEYTVYGSNWMDAMKVAAAAGEAPELFQPSGQFLLDFVKAGYMVPVTDLPGGDEFVAQYEGSLVKNQHIFNGKVYALPYNLTTFKFIVNDDLFKKAGITEYPKTWDDVREDAKIITQAGKGQEYGWILGLQSNWMISSYVTRPNAANVGHLGFNWETMKFDYSAFGPVIGAIKGMVDDKSVFPGFEGLDADAARAQFAEGRVGMIVGASFDTAVYNEQFPAKCNWSVIPIPSFTEAGAPYKEFVDATSLLGAGTAALDKPEKSLEVMKFFYSDENMAQMYEQSLYIPYRQEAIDLAKSQPAQKGFAEFSNVPEKNLMLPSPDSNVTVEGDAYRETIMKFFAGGYGKEDATTVLADLDDRYNKALGDLDPALLKDFELSPDVLEGLKK
ncbi:MAG: ABC transporter substrate-binding protein [Anaerocolumna sp.]